jgi:lipoprotein-anchoring transpeptidase ErfK/SrfK
MTVRRRFGAAVALRVAFMRVGVSAYFVISIGLASPALALFINPAAAQEGTAYTGNEAQPAGPAPVLAPPAANRRGAYGGGLLEFLFAGGSDAAPAGPRLAPRPLYGAPIEAQPPSSPYPRVAAITSASPGIVDPAPMAIPEEFRRQDVDYDGRERPGTIIIDTPHRFLYLVEPGARAIRYGVGVGRPGFEWSGVKYVSRKAEWPGWTPPVQMMLRRPDLPSHMDGGMGNPLGARALYLGSSLFRIHGTNEPETIGHNVSSGCIRMMNEDVIDLYNRVPVGSKVIVI